MASHAFLCNVHRDVAQAERLSRLLMRHYGESRLLACYDGPPGVPDVENILCNHMFREDYEPDKTKSILQCLNRLMAEARDMGIEFATFLHADMIPVFPEQFRLFLDRFEESGKALTYTTMWPDHPCISYCDLTFSVPQAFDMDLFPVQHVEAPKGQKDFNELQTTWHFNRAYPHWRDRAYPLWSIVKPYVGEYKTVDGLIHKYGHTAELAFRVHNFTPETSVLHTDDEIFWANAGRIMR